MAIGESYYLTHDIDALNDIKISALCHEFGFEAYGLFWVCLEHMFPEECLSLPYDDMTFVAIKRQTNTTCDVKAFVDRAIEYGLFERDGDMFYSTSFIKRMAKLDEEAEARSEKARNAANARWQKKREHSNGNADAMLTQCTSNAQAMHEQCSSNANAMLNDAYEMNRNELNRTNNNSCANEPEKCASNAQTPVVNKKKTEQQANAQRFDVFWNAYPRKTDKKRARKRWDALKVDDALLEKMIRAIDAQKQSDQWRRDDGQFIPHPTTWLNGERWEDSTERITVPKPREPTRDYYSEPDFIDLMEMRKEAASG